MRARPAARFIQRAKAFCAYSRTILVARLYTLLGLLVALQGAILPWLMGQDWTPVFTWLLSGVPDGLRPMLVGLAIVITGEIFAYLRRLTTKSLPEKIEHAKWQKERVDV